MIFNFIIFLVFICHVAATFEGIPKNWGQFETFHGKSMEKLFEKYKTVFGKKFLDTSDELSHFNNFKSKVASVFDWNDGKHSYTKGINHFTDLSPEERRHFVMADTKMIDKPKPRSSDKAFNDLNFRIKSKSLVGVGDSKVCDLRPFATAVKNQASCGSCWAFGTIAAAEGSHFLWSMTSPSGNPVTSTVNNAWQLSEQVIIECCWADYDSNGCGGGGVSGPMQCAVDMGELASTVSHPYLATTANTTCSHKKSEAAGHVQAWYEPCSIDEDCLKKYIGGDSCDVFSAASMKTSIEVIDSFYDYEEGVYSDEACPSDIHNHAVAIVGWGTDDSTGQDYWIIRNSWGPTWGNEGYIFMLRGSNMCCVACENLFFQ